jgi:hypothetical protein
VDSYDCASVELADRGREEFLTRYGVLATPIGTRQEVGLAPFAIGRLLGYFVWFEGDRDARVMVCAHTAARGPILLRAPRPPTSLRTIALDPQLSDRDTGLLLADLRHSRVG